MQQTITTYHISVLDKSQMRLDLYLATQLPEYSRSNISTWIKQVNVKINSDTILKAKEKITYKDHIEIKIKLSNQNDTWHKQNIKINIIFEDEEILLINKPAGLTVHPGAGQADNTLANALHYYDENQNKLPRMGIVHRLDKDTSGIMVVAKTLKAHKSLVTQLQNRTILKTYHAIITGTIIAGATIVNKIGRDPNKRTAMTVNPNGKEAITHYRVIKKFEKHTLLQVNIETGRTHQIRVHMSHIKHPIVGDKTYGKTTISSNTAPHILNSIKKLDRQALHAFELELDHPGTNERIKFTCPYPNDFEELLNSLDIVQ